MVDAARQMLDELMGRNRNLHPSEAVRKVNWDDPDYCQYYMVDFCPHDLFINTRADLGPCSRLHDDEAKDMFEKSRPCSRKRQYEDEFLRFCNSMLNDVDRKIQKGKQRLQLMNRDQPLANQYVSKYHEQINNLNARIKKLLAEAEEAGIRGDVDQAQDLMSLCEQLKEEKEALVGQHENANSQDASPSGQNEKNDNHVIPEVKQPNEIVTSNEVITEEKKLPAWMHDLGTLPEKQMEVCEICGAFLIVGDAQQRIEDHLMGKQHLGYSRLRKAVDDIHEKRKKEREDDDSKRREERCKYSSTSGRSDDRNRDRRDRERDRSNRERHVHSREHGSSRHHSERHRHHKSHHRRRSHSRSRRGHDSRSRSRSRY